MANKQTAVEWLFDKITQNEEIRWRGTRHLELFEQAKQMEKEQIINARINGDENHTFNSMMREDYANDYYNETYGQST